MEQLTAEAIRQIEPMTWEDTGGGVYCLYTGTLNADGYYECVIGPFCHDGTMQDEAVYVGHDGSDYNIPCETVDAVRTALGTLRSKEKVA